MNDTPARLARETFRTSRLAEYCSEPGLVVQSGHPVADWPLVIAKELADNSIDAAEEARVPPVLAVRVSTRAGEIVVADNGGGIPAETIAGIIDYTSRTSSRAGYVSPTRGQQGNALSGNFSDAVRALRHRRRDGRSRVARAQAPD